MRGATAAVFAAWKPAAISIHAPHAGSDFLKPGLRKVHLYFNPRSPCGERRGTNDRNRLNAHFNPRSPCGERPGIAISPVTLIHFNPRSPCGERRFAPHTPMTNDYFNPRSPCGERLAHIPYDSNDWDDISIHAPHAGSDPGR